MLTAKAVYWNFFTCTFGVSWLGKVFPACSKHSGVLLLTETEKRKTYFFYLFFLPGAALSPGWIINQQKTLPVTWCWWIVFLDISVLFWFGTDIHHRSVFEVAVFIFNFFILFEQSHYNWGLDVDILDSTETDVSFCSTPTAFPSTGLIRDLSFYLDSLFIQTQVWKHKNTCYTNFIFYVWHMACKHKWQTRPVFFNAGPQGSVPCMF